MTKCQLCTKHALYNFEGLKPLFCSEHSSQGMVNVHAKHCIDDHCRTRASYNFPGNKTALYCHTHSKPGMTNVKKQTCLKCNTRPTKNKVGETKPIYCSKHAEPGMTDVESKRCIESNCNRFAQCNRPEIRTALYCCKHKKEGMVNLFKKTCAHDGCEIGPTRNYPDKKEALYCHKHALPKMIDVKNKVCIDNDCTIRPSRNFPGKKVAIYCTFHAKEGMVNVKHKTCEHDKCTTIPTRNFSNQQKPKYCVLHAIKGMVDVVSPRCKTPLCDIIVTKKYDGYCFRCYIHMNPDKPVSRNFKVKEKHVTDAVQELLESKGYKQDFILDKQIQGGCSKKRPDMFLDLLTHVIVVEIDEEQHKKEEYTSCETNWLASIFSDVAERPTIFLRFNPDKYTSNDKKHKSCFKVNKQGIRVLNCKKDFAERIEMLTSRIIHYIDTPVEKLMTVEYLFYDK